MNPAKDDQNEREARACAGEEVKRERVRNVGEVGENSAGERQHGADVG